MGLEGLVNLNKPVGPTSHDMVDLVRRLLHQRRVGHGGTLDPLAQGVLPIGIGRATRLLPFFHEQEKVYRAEVVLGRSTTTYDAEGEVTAVSPLPPLGRSDIEAVLAAFVGEIEQIPPPFSAIRWEGRRLYERARAGEPVEPPARRVRIIRLDVLGWQEPLVVVRVTCGSGTYIRSLAHEIGQRLGCGAYLAGLVRLRVGPFCLEQALTPAALADAVAGGRLAEVLQPLESPVQHWPAVVVDAAQASLLSQGRPLVLPPEAAPDGAGRLRAHDGSGDLLALLRWREAEGVWHPFRVFPAQRHEGEG